MRHDESKHETDEINTEVLCKALAIQFQAFVNSDTEEADDVVAIEYQKGLNASCDAAAQTHAPFSTLYPGGNIYLKTAYRPTHHVATYEIFTHTWEFENTGTQVWHGRGLCFANQSSVRPVADKVYIDLPETPPQKGVKVSVSMDARGFEELSECKWIMVDSDKNNCFPNTETFTFLVDTKFKY